MFFIYSLLYFIAAAILLPFEYLKRPADVRKRWLREKFGFVGQRRSAHGSPLIWVHAVSVGEVISATPFLKEIKRRYPSVHIILSTITDTGQKVARERVSEIVDIVYPPFDLVIAIKNLLSRITPALFIVMETELWPNTFKVLKDNGIPVLVMNGRLSEKSFKGYRRIRFFMKSVLEHVDMFCMQDETYAGRIMALGANAEKVAVTGNFKFDTKPPDQLPGWAGALTGPVILAGSTHAGEEEMLVSVFEKLRQDFPDLNLVIAPRHPERFREVEELIHKNRFACIRASNLTRSGGGDAVRAEASQNIGLLISQQHSSVILLDVMGDLASAYSVCDIAVIGGSFIRHGGQNPLEPAFWGKPVICGPHMENFPFIDDFYKEGAAAKTDEEGLHDILKDLLVSPEKRKKMGGKAKTLYFKNAGTVNRALDFLERYIKLPLALPEEKPLS